MMKLKLKLVRKEDNEPVQQHDACSPVEFNKLNCVGGKTQTQDQRK